MTRPKDGPAAELRPTGRCRQAGSACGEFRAATSSLAASLRSALQMLPLRLYSAADAARLAESALGAASIQYSHMSDMSKCAGICLDFQKALQ